MSHVATLPSLFHSINFQVSAHAELKPSLPVSAPPAWKPRPKTS